MRSSVPPNVTRVGDATVIRDEDASNPVAVRFDHVTKRYKLFRNDKLRLLATFSKRVPYSVVNANDDLSFTVPRGEALAVGDRKFARKCRERVSGIIANENVTVLFVTHSTSMAKEFCHRGIVIRKGRAVFGGDIKEAIDFYESS
ncbi:hypothetical protein [Bifidobacterium jacchi]|uniref:ABC transporter ATP-binding protein n=1 Tax=Bifidobacterium jacchi TaxID=2490545 RepID=A0A5N5RFZ6_9BIFI|nr:hypothetical protein [Bifidobacterium jacchi]KAB5606153.1 hypothetical protein EHS19_07980 [Bifidobacterium jacchi]